MWKMFHVQLGHYTCSMDKVPTWLMYVFKTRFYIRTATDINLILYRILPVWDSREKKYGWKYSSILLLMNVYKDPETTFICMFLCSKNWNLLCYTDVTHWNTSTEVDIGYIQISNRYNWIRKIISCRN